MNKYIAQPYYGDPSASPPVQPAVKIYSLADASLVTTISFGSRGPNCVVLYQDSGNVYYLFVSFDFGATGAVEVYEFPSINDLTNAASLPIPTTISFPDSVAGMAVHPGTGDLYVAAFSNGDGNGGVFHCPKGPTGYAASSLFSSNADPSVTFVCANLAFDFHGNLWMTTFDAAGGQFLICYTRVSPADKSKFFKITNGQAFSTLTNLPGSAPAPGAMLPFSAPEGIAFDPAGNLWVANNNDVSDFFATNGAGNGTLLRISKVWIDTNLLNYGNLYGAPGFGMAFPFVKDDPSVAVYYLNNAEFGGLLFDGFTLYANDQGNGKVWRWDVTPDPATHLPNPLNFQTSGISTTYPGNGTMAIFDTTPASLLMKDGALDAGIEPDPAIGFGVFGPVWESVDIAVTVTTQLGGVLPNGDHAPAGISLTSTPTIR